MEKLKKKSCNVYKHIIEETNHPIEDFDVHIFVQLENVTRENAENSWKIIGKLH